MDSKTIMMIVLGVVSVASLMFVFLAPTQKDKAAKRASRLTNKTVDAKGGGANADSGKDRRKAVADSLKKIEDRNKEHAKKQKLTLEQRIAQAGMNFNEKQFYIGSVICGIVFLAIGLITRQNLAVTGLMGVVGVIGVPNWFLSHLRKRRQGKFVLEFSNAIEVIVRGVKSGLPVNECLKMIARDAQEPVRTEFHLLTEGIRVGLSLEQSLDRMYERMPINEVKFYSIVLLIQQQTGGNLAEALGNLSGVLRNRKMMLGKIAALSMEAKASAVILGALPFVVAGLVHMSAPDYLQPLLTTSEGNMILIGAGIWMSIGIFVMRSMIQIKV